MKKLYSLTHNNEKKTYCKVHEKSTVSCVNEHADPQLTVIALKEHFDNKDDKILKTIKLNINFLDISRRRQETRMKLKGKLSSRMKGRIRERQGLLLFSISSKAS